MGGERYGEEEGREGRREMDHPASECVMVGRVGGRVKQMSQAGDEIRLLLCFFFSLSSVCSVILRPKKRVDPEKVAECQKNPLLPPPVAAVDPADASLRLTFASC